MAVIEDDLRRLLSGEIVPVDSEDFHCSYNDLSVPEDNYLPVVKRTVCYIVMALVFDDAGRVVLIQEAKAGYRGKWYIPAGRVEPGENLIDGVKREALEETGLEFEPLTVISVEISELRWYRIGYIGRAVGGKLKTLEESDAESLQAQWFPVDEILNEHVQPLRHKDFFKALKIGQKYMSQRETDRHPGYQIGTQPYKHLLYRMLVIKSSDEGSVEVLCYQKNGSFRIPCCRLNSQDYSLSSAFNYLMKAFCQSKTAFQMVTCPVKGLLTLEHCGKSEREHDGMCLTTVFLLPSNLHNKLAQLPNKIFLWHEVTDPSLLQELKRRVEKEDMLIPVL